MTVDAKERENNVAFNALVCKGLYLFSLFLTRTTSGNPSDLGFKVQGNPSLTESGLRV